ncbi:MAG TPA: hypothetical protein VLR49_15085 [Ferruginibacter sp.]|nr:hypothetical protein [Ferruginibacter sp.]
MSLRHLGEIKNGIEEQKDWAGATENYFLQENNNFTSLDVEMDTTPEMEVYLKNTFPNAMEKLKQICEQ